MTWHWKELLPVDHFSVRTSYYITEIDRLTLTLLYQPLIGSLAHSLYVTLLSQLERDQFWSMEQTHRQLMLFLGESLEMIYDARKKLEAIGLLKTFKMKDADRANYVYELQPPMTPKQFFENDVLSVYLFNRFGETHYRLLRERFMLDIIPTEEYMEMTYAFDEVFTSLHHSEMVSNLQSETGNALQLSKDKELVTKGNHQEFVFKNEQFDFDLFEKSLSKTIAPNEVLTGDVRKLIGRLAFVYRIEPLEMSSIVSNALIHDDQLDPNELRKKAQDWYKIEHGTEPPALGLQIQPEKHRVMTNREPMTEEEHSIKFYETTSPLELLEIHAAGSHVDAADVKIVEALIVDFELLPGVVNVLLDFMLFSHDMKLPKALIGKIAGHWSRKKVQTVQEAMQLARSEKKKLESIPDQKTGYKKQTPQKNLRRDKLPKWLVAEKKKEQKKTSEQVKTQDVLMNQQTSEEEISFEQMLEELKKSKE
ncbi:helicase DnaB [bacterium LRH843]|nr:helicase DnaB [bacterium LRH843]